MPEYVEVVVNVPKVQGKFHYHVPLALQEQVQPGCLVAAPFGAQQVQGVVVRRVAVPQVPETRAIEGLLDPEPVLTAAQLALAEWLEGATLAAPADCLSVMLPPGLSQRAERTYALIDPATSLPGKSPAAQLVALLAERGPLRAAQISRALPALAWENAARRLLKTGVLSVESELPPPRVRPKVVRTASLGLPPVAARERLAALRSGAAATRRAAIIDFLAREGVAVAAPWVCAATGGQLSDLQRLAEAGIVVLGDSEVWRDPLETLAVSPAVIPTLTADQGRVWQTVAAELGRAAAGESVPPLLLEGVTGSGKTEIYLRAVEETLRLGRQAIVLVPEIALTPQTVRRFAARFPGQVGLIHSRLSDGERYDTWRRARAGLLPVIVGPRSALFAPLARLGLIVVDESHDDSYYQSDPPPRYHGREAALALARLAGAVCLMGTATPDVVSAQQVLEGRYTDLRLPGRILAHREAVDRHRQVLGERVRFRPLEADAASQGLPPIHLVDMRQELIEGSRGLLSRRLQVALGETLAHGEQAILLLNRLGAATYVFCRVCGTSVKCPRCDLPLTYHQDHRDDERETLLGGLRCHRCGYRRQLVRRCPVCGSDQIRHMGAGTERVEAEVQALFPAAQTLRWDTTTTGGKDAHEVILANFAAGRANVLVGTQMVAKGLDLPLVTLVGVVLAEVGLNLPDYRAAERTFQLLVQVAGRAGRSPLGGQVVMQTFQPEHYAIQAAARHDQAGFLRQELSYRRELGYPPFTQLVRLETRQREARRAQAEAERLAGWLRRRIQVEERTATSLIGPAPCFFARLGGFYRWQVVIRGPDPVSLLAGRNWPDWRIEVNPPSLL